MDREKPPPPRSPTLSGQWSASATGLEAFTRGLELTSLWRWAWLSILVGAVVGFAACAFYLALEWVQAMVLYGAAGFDPPLPGGENALAPGTGRLAQGWTGRILLAILPALGGLFAGLIAWKYAPEASGHGTDSMIDAFHRGRSRIRPRVPVVKAICSIFTIGTGGSAGREGPISQIGAGFGSYVAELLHLTERERRLLLLAGAAGGISALFRTPLGAALWALEVLYREDFETEGLFPCLVSSVTAYSIFTTLFGQGHLFATELAYVFKPAQLPLYGLMAVFLSALGLLWIKMFYGIERRVFRPMRMPRWLKPVMGGLGLGLVGLALPHVLGIGYGWVQDALNHRQGAVSIIPGGWTGAGFFLGIGVAKMLATSLTVGSGGSGGVFAPSIVIGGLLGGAFGLAAHQLLPGVVPQPGAFVLVGMGCFYGGVGHVPLSSLVIVCELAGSYDLLVPLMLAVMTSYLLLRRFTLYEKQVANQLQSPAHFGDFTVDVLEDLRVADAFDRTQGTRTVRSDMRLRDFLAHVSQTGEWIFPVVDLAGALRGVVSLADVRGVIADSDALDVVVVGDAMQPLKTVHPEASLRTALAVFMQTGYAHLPVVNPIEPEKVMGFLAQQDLIRAYNAEILRRRVGVDVSRAFKVPKRPDTQP
jgi:chloride channel protein, CIC family